MPRFGPSVDYLSTIEISRLLAQDSGLSEQEARRVFRSLRRVIRQVLLTGRGLSFGQDFRLVMKPHRESRYFHPSYKCYMMRPRKWTVAAVISGKFLKELGLGLGPPTDLDIKNYKNSGKRRRKVWKSSVKFGKDYERYLLNEQDE